MKLSYRGIPYEQAPSLETTEGEITGQYRGVSTTFRTHPSVSIPNAIVNLKYRGNAYLGER